jgi:Pyruvate/2-oxoacid:ferredoxin oxidoreductase delta subunit
VSDNIYRRLANVLDTLPNGFPSTPNGLEIRILKKIFTPDEAELFCDLKLSLETAEQIAQRTNRPLDGLEAKLTSMAKRGEVLGINFGGTKLFAMIPWAVGIYEYQIDRMDREFCELCEEYRTYFGPQLLGLQPQIMQTVAIEEDIPTTHQALPYQQVSAIIEKGAAFWVNECICKKERGMMGTPCTKPRDVCLAIGPVAGAGLIFEWGRSISKQEAYELLHQAEEAGLVHLASNVASGHTFICNCCACCCLVLRTMNEFGLTGVINSYFYAEIEEDGCNNCGICLEERCQVKAIENVDDTYRVVKDRCIGCGLCITECPTDAIRLVPKPPAEIMVPPDDVDAWNEERARRRGIDYRTYR